MRKFISILMFVTLLVGTSQAVIIAFEAEDERLIYQEGDKWNTVEDETALNVKYITGSENMPASNETSFRGFSFPVTAGTYTLYARIELEEAGGWYNNDSVYMSDSTFAQAASVTTAYNQIDARTDVEGTSMSSVGFKWCQIDTGYVMAADGTGYLMVSPREDGLRIDAFAYATADETITTAILDAEVLKSHFLRGAATNPTPDLNAVIDKDDITALEWVAPGPSHPEYPDPNIADVRYYDVYFGTDPNIVANPVTSPVDVESLSVSLAYNTTYYWRVDTNLTWDSNDIAGGSFDDIVIGSEWKFTTLPQDKTPVVTAADYLTAFEYLPDVLTATVNDHGENDIANIAWEVLVPATAQQMINRTDAAHLANLAQITSDPSLLRDWIGADTRNEGGKAAGNPLTLTLKGLPAGTYTWTSYHHDGNDQRGVFDVTVHDAYVSSPVTTTNIPITDANSTPVSTFTTAIVSDGSDITLAFTLHPYDYDDQASTFAESFFVMNGFELTKGVDSLAIDFGPVGGPLMTGYQAYEASHEIASSFTEQSYTAFGTTVGVLPTWGGVATAVGIGDDWSLATQQATFTADRPGEYSVRVSATDNTIYGPVENTGWATLTVTVAADACAAAQLSPSWTGFSIADINEDCVVNLEDFAELAAVWLDDRNLTAQE